MRLGIDASNLRAGGGVTHLLEMLRAANPNVHGFSQVIVWGGKATLNQIEDRPWLLKKFQPSLDRALPYRVYWQRFKLSKLARIAGCELLFVPGGSYAGDFHPVATMSRNLLPFDCKEIARYGLSLQTAKLLLLHLTQSVSFRRADGLIFLSQFAKETVLRSTGPLRGRVIIIPHGVDHRFSRAPRPQKSIDEYSTTTPFRLLYVSTVDIYKHQWNVAEAVHKLRGAGIPLALDLVGPAYPPALKRLRKVLTRIDPNGNFIRYRGSEQYRELHNLYGVADACVFASSCENMPNILLEGMASGLPIACSDRGSMPEVLGSAGVYFDPENVDSIGQAIQRLVASPTLRKGMAQAAFERVSAYSWHRSADETLAFLSDVTSKFHGAQRA